MNLIQDFEGTFAEELKHRSHFFKQDKMWEFKGRQILVYPWKIKEKLTYAIAFPVRIEEEKTNPTHILWNWPPLIPFYSPRCIPIIPWQPGLGIIVHASGEDKVKIDAEIARLFSKLAEGVLAESVLERDLGRFLYLFFQSLPFKRGSAAIGVILMNLILKIYDRLPPDFPPGFRFLECEAMCAAEEEFTHGLSVWLRNGPFFE